MCCRIKRFLKCRLEQSKKGKHSENKNVPEISEYYILNDFDKAISTEAQFIFENGQGGQKDETGAELMEVDQYAPQIKTLTTLGQYLQYQVDHQQASDEINEESNTQRREKNKNDCEVSQNNCSSCQVI